MKKVLRKAFEKPFTELLADIKAENSRAAILVYLQMPVVRNRLKIKSKKNREEE